MVNHEPLPPQVLKSVNRALAGEIDMGAAKISLAPYFANGRRPGFWADSEVLRALTVLYRQVTIEQAATAVRELCGTDRAPGKSSVQRYWAVIDKAVKAGRWKANG